ncbi:hypothetical protein JMN32_09615 [Fulvivirga sp. 29W222]|uniref:Uncharacterized protein n=1 Tax=Fulvivirga marina TaxID=2494733 RepID=A0A937KBQ8_9BACT|nr:hypothetical protein [Fulvivirga marina]MBL6446567.1 hypothetical protein [Fulvivirga marina]
MKHIIKYIEDNPGLSKADVVYRIMDPLFDYFRAAVGENIVLLNKSRQLLRTGNKTSIQEGLLEFENFKNSWKRLIDALNELRELYNADKSILVLDEMLNMSVKRSLQTKIPKPLKNYLDETKISESDIDWIIRKIKDYWGKYSQVYASARMNQLSKSL